MPKRNYLLTGVVAFGAGVAFGALLPKSGGWVENILKKLGFEWAELLLLWDPEAESKPKLKQLKRGTAKKKKAVINRRGTKPVRLATSRSTRAVKAAAARN